MCFIVKHARKGSQLKTFATMIQNIMTTQDFEALASQVWHDASEEPQGEYEIICQDEFRHVWLTDYREDINHYKNGWKECAECECIVRWAYIEDLLPK